MSIHKFKFLLIFLLLTRQSPSLADVDANGDDDIVPIVKPPCFELFYTETDGRPGRIGISGTPQDAAVKIVPSTIPAREPYPAQFKPIIKNFFPKRKDSIYYTRVITKDSKGSEVVGNALVIRESGWDKKQLPKLYVSIPGGPGLSGLTLGNLTILGNDHLLLIPPGNDLPHDPMHTDLGEIRKPYQAWVDSFIAMILQERRSPDQEVVLIAHSYGGFYAADLMKQALETTNIKIKGAAFIAAPLTKSTYNAIESRRKNAKIPLWNETYAEYELAFKSGDKKRTADLYRKLVLLYGPLLHNDHPITKNQVEMLIANDPVSPQAMVFNTRRFDDSEEIVLSLQRLLTTHDLDFVSILGENDQLMDFDLARVDHRNAGIEVVPVKSASHFPHIDDVRFVIETAFTNSLKPVERN